MTQNSGRNGAKRIGVFVCHCGLNIAGVVDVEKVVEEMSHYPGVVHADHYMYMCSDPGQDLVRRIIHEYDLDGLVMSNCSPSLHERTFRRLAAAQGLNPYHVEVANIREHCSWPHGAHKEIATRKAISIIKATVERLRLNLELTPASIPLTKRALVIGGGVAGMEAALDVADSGYEVVLVEKSPTLGGHAAQLSGTFPTLDRPPCLIMPMMTRVSTHPRIAVHTLSEVEEVSGYVGNLVVKLRRKPRYVDEKLCDNCGLCIEKCPASAPSEFDRGLSQRKAIYLPFAQATPRLPCIDPASCKHFIDNSCRICADVCPRDAIDFTQQEAVLDETVGAAVVASGYDLFPRERVPEFAEDVDVLDGLQFERMLSPSGPTGGVIKRPSDGTVPKQVVFVQCVGTRDPEHGVAYCSRVCCMYVAKQAALYKQAVPDGQVYIFYMDIRSDAKGYEQFVKKATEEHCLLYLRGRVSRLFRDGDKITVWGADTLSGKSVQISADLVVLALGMVPSPGARDLARKLNTITDGNGFMTEAHLKLRPVETLTSGIYLAGTAQWPRDLPDSISSASGAASKILSLFSRKELLHEPTIAYVDEEVCAGCGVCASVCTYKAIQIDPRKKVARVNEALCEGCGACAATCPSKAMKHKNWGPRQFLNMLDVMTAEYV